MLTLLLAAGCGSGNSRDRRHPFLRNLLPGRQKYSPLPPELSFRKLWNGQIEVFAPSSMTLAMNDLIEAYKEESGIGKIVANYSDSASLSDQIRNNADCDIFICEDPSIARSAGGRKSSGSGQQSVPLRPGDGF